MLDTCDDARRRIRPTENPQLFAVGQKFDTGERFLTGMGTVWYRNAFPLSLGNYVPAIASDLPANKRRPVNPLRDGFIAETALLNRMTLVTADRRLQKSRVPSVQTLNTSTSVSSQDLSYV